MPLGEQYIKLVSVSDYAYSYMYFVTLAPANVEACAAILSSGWEETLPEEWWSFGRLWIGSDAGERDIYGSSTTFSSEETVTHYAIPKRSMAEITRDCATICNDELSYCTITFDFLGYN